MKNLFLAFLAGAALWLNARAASLPDKLRVFSLDLRNSRVETPGTPGSELSQDLRRILEAADVDIVCVQGAVDWENCERICQLKPGLQVLTCSAFASTPQVAILSRAGAVLSWVDESEGGNGFALAILQAGGHKLGVFSVQSAKPAAGAAGPASTERVLPEVNKLKKFPQNRPDSFLMTGPGMAKATLLTDNGFQTVAAEPAAPGCPEFFIQNGGFLTRPRSVVVRGLKIPAVVCDFDTSSSFSSKFAYQTPLLFPGESLASLQAASQPAPRQDFRWLIWVGAVAMCILILGLLLRRPRPVALEMVRLGAGTPDSLAPACDPVRSNLLAWIKSAFLQRLISHRQELLNNEAEATRRTLMIEQKLTSLQSEIQARISAYEARIDRLEQELTAAAFENRELIRAQIELLKEKVAKAKQERTLDRN